MFSLDKFISAELAMAKKQRHPSMQRLLDFVKDQDIVTPRALAAALVESEQTVANWSARGVSAAGAIAAERKFGCSAVWVLDGINPPLTKKMETGWSIDHMFLQLPADPILRGKVHHEAMKPIMKVLNEIELSNAEHGESATLRTSGERHH